MSLLASLHPRALYQRYRAHKHKQANAKKPETFKEHLVAWVKTLVWALTVVTILNGLALASFVVPTGSMENTVLPGEFLFVNKAIYGPSTPQVIPFFNIPLPFVKLPALKAPAVGDVIVFIFPGGRDQPEASEFQYYLKRCMGTPGDVVEIRNRQVIVNGNRVGLPEHGKYIYDQLHPQDKSNRIEVSQFSTFPAGYGNTIDNWGPIRVPKEGDVIDIKDQKAAEAWAIFIRREGHTFDPVTKTLDGRRVDTYTVERNYVFGMGDNRDNSEDSRFFGFIPEHDVVGTPMMVYWSWENLDMTGRERSLFEKLSNIRWSRIGTIIR